VAVEFEITEEHKRYLSEMGVKVKKCSTDRLISFIYGLYKGIFSNLPNGTKITRNGSMLGTNFQWVEPGGEYGAVMIGQVTSPFSCCGASALSTFWYNDRSESKRIFEELLRLKINHVPTLCILVKVLDDGQWIYHKPAYEIVAKYSIPVSEFRNVLYNNHLLELRMLISNLDKKDMIFDTTPKKLLIQ